MIRAAILLVSVCFVFGLPPDSAWLHGQGKPKEDKRIKQLQNEQKKLARTNNPESRSKSLIKIAEITLSYLTEAASSNDFAMMKSYVEQYRQAVTDARDTMMRSGLDPHKKSGGYKAVEIALRRQIRNLQESPGY